MIHIGNKIENVFKNSGLTKTAFAERINKGRENVYDIFKRESIDTELLYRIGQVLNHDFFQYFVEDGQPTETKEPKEIYTKPTKKKTRILVELELDTDEMIKLGLKDKVITALNLG